MSENAILFRAHWNISACQLFMSSHNGQIAHAKANGIKSPTEIMNEVINLAMQSGIRLLPETGMRYFSCAEETFYLGFKFDCSTDKEKLNRIVGILNETKTNIVTDRQHAMYDTATKLWHYD